MMRPGARRYTIDTENPTKRLKKDDWKSFPRCEYKARFTDTTAFEMSDPRFWGTYYRSTKSGGNYDRLNTIRPEMGTPQKRTRRRASSGHFNSPYIRHQYNLRSSTATTHAQQSIKSTNANNLYDQQLKYKCKLCELVVEKYNSINAPKRITVYVRNDFPCILVKLDLLKGSLGEKHLYEICSAYFCAIANFFAIKNKVPIEMVIRASIGHNLTSISATKTSFRINIGIVPAIYATSVLVESFEWFNQNYKNILMEKLSLNVEDIQKINSGIQAYNEVKKTKSKNPKHLVIWNQEETILKTLCKRGDSSGRSVVVQLTRLKQYIDLLCDYVHAEVMHNLEELQLSARPLRKMLSKYCFEGNQVKMNIGSKDYTEQQFKFPKHENGEIKGDTEFWEIVHNIALAIKMINVVGTKKVYGLHGMIENANSKFINNCPQIFADGYGSDSDGEVCIDLSTKLTHFVSTPEKKVACFCRKVVVQTGMRAINLAYALAKCLTETKKACTRHMYYETRDAITNASDQIAINNLAFPKSKQKLIRFIDLNFCANTPEKTSIVDLELIKVKSEKANERVIVFDYTSATSGKINKAIRLFLPYMEVILLVNSGSKNEQIGADNNPYGTIRIVSTNFGILDELYSALIKTLDLKMESLPKHLHNIRKAYKSTGTVLTYNGIFKKDWKPSGERLNSTV